MSKSIIASSYIVPGQAHILLAKDKSPAWFSLYNSYERVRQEILDINPDIIVYFSTQWLSVLGYMVQGDPEPKGKHVDANWHELGTMDFHFKVDESFAKTCTEEIKKLGFDSKCVRYDSFPIDTGTIVAENLLNPDKKFPTAMISCSIYSDQEETINLGKAVAHALHLENKCAVVVLVSGFSNRFFTTDIDPREDHISSTEDDQWNRRILSSLEKGAFKDVLNDIPEFAKQACADLGFKGFWWLYGLLGGSNRYKGKLFDYQAVWGTGAALLGFYPEQNVFYSEEKTLSQTHTSEKAPEAVGPYPHARREGNLLFLSGLGPRVRGSKNIPGVTLDANGNIQSYDIEIQTHSVFQNIKTILEECGSSLDKVIDCQVYLTHMKNDFSKFNSVYKDYFNAETGPTRTTIEVLSLPTPIAVELKVIARI